MIYGCLLAAFLGLAGKSFCAPPPPRVVVLANGVRVIVVVDHSLPLVAVNIVVRAGSANEEKGQYGVAHLLEHLLFRGSRNYPPGAVGEMVENLGGSVNAGTLRDFTHVYAVVPRSGFEKTLTALSDALLYPVLEEAEIEKERGVLLGEIANQNEEPQAVLWDMAHQALMPEHPYSHPVSGDLTAMFFINREQLQRFHRQWFVPERISLIVVGDVSEEQILTLSKQIFEQLPGGMGGKDYLSEEANSLPADEVKYHGGALTFIGLAAKAPGISSPREVCALDVLLSLLAESKTARLRQNLLGNPQTAFSVGGEYLTSRYPSPFLLWASCLPNQREGVKSRMETALEEIIAGKVTPAELAAAKSSMLTSFWLSNETFDDRADVLGFYEALQNLQFGREYARQVRAVGLTDIQAAANRYFAKPNRAWVELIPAGKTDKPSL